MKVNPNLDEDQKLVDRFNSQYQNQGISAHFEERPNTVQAVIDDYNRRVAEAAAAGKPPPSPPRGIDMSKNKVGERWSNRVLVVERRRNGGDPDEVDRTEFTYDSKLVETKDPKTGARVKVPVLMMKSALIPPTLTVNDPSNAFAPGLVLGDQAHTMARNNESYMTPHQTALALLRRTFGDEGAAHGFTADTIDKRWTAATAHLPTASSSDYRGLEGALMDPRQRAGITAMLQIERGPLMTRRNWTSVLDSLPSSGYKQGPLGSSHAFFTYSDEQNRRRSQNIVLATHVNASWQAATPGGSRMLPGGILEGAFKGKPGKIEKAIASAVKRENMHDRTGNIPEGVVRVPGLSGDQDLGFITVTSLGIRRMGNGGVDEAGNPIEEGRLEYADPVGGGQGVGSTNAFDLRSISQPSNKYFYVPRDSGIDIRNFRTRVRSGDVIPYMGGTVAEWGRGNHSRSRNPRNIVELDRMGDMGGQVVLAQGFSFGSDDRSAKHIKRLLGSSVTETEAEIRAILRDKASIEDPTSARYKRRAELEQMAVGVLNDLQVDRDYFDETGAKIDKSDPRYAAAVEQAREDYRIVWAGPGGKGGKTSFVPVIAYSSKIDSVKGPDRKILLNHIPTTPATRAIIQRAQKALVDPTGVSVLGLREIDRMIMGPLAVLHESSDQKFQEASDMALQTIADVATVSMHGPSSGFSDAAARARAGTATPEDDDRLTLSGAAEGLPAVPVVMHSVDEIKNSPDHHTLTLAAYWHLGSRGMHSNLPNAGERDPFNVSEIYKRLYSRFGSAAEMLKDDPATRQARQEAFFELLDLSPQIGGRINYYQVTSHVNVEPAGTKDTVNATSIEEIEARSKDPLFQKFINKGDMDNMSQAARIISTLFPAGLQTIDITEEDMKTASIPEFREAEADERFYAVRDIYDAARKRVEKETGKKVGRGVSMRFAIPGFVDPETGEQRKLTVASPYSFQGLERSASGETLVRFVESLQSPTRKNVMNSSPVELHNQHMAENRDYAESPGGQKALQNFSGKMHGVAMRYGFAPQLQDGQLLIGPHHAPIFAEIFGIKDPREFWRRIMAGEEFHVDSTRFPQQEGAQGMLKVVPHPDFMGHPSTNEKDATTKRGDFDGDLNAFIAAMQRMAYEKYGKKYTENVYLPGMTTDSGPGAQNAAALASFASFYNPDEFHEHVHNARNVVEQYFDNELIKKKEVQDAFYVQYGVKPGDASVDKEAYEAARNVEIDRLTAQAMVDGMDVLGEDDRRYRVKGLDQVFAGKAQRIGTEMVENLLPVDLRMTGSKEDLEKDRQNRLNQVKSTVQGVTVTLTPEQSGALAEDENMAKREMGIYTPISALQSVLATSDEHNKAINEAAREEYGENELERLTRALSPQGWYTASYAGQASQGLGLSYQRALDMLVKPDSLKKYSKDFFTADIRSWKDDPNPIVENAMMAMLQSEEISPLAFAAAFGQMPDLDRDYFDEDGKKIKRSDPRHAEAAKKASVNHIRALMQKSKALKEKINASKEAAAAKTGDEMSEADIRDTEEWQQITSGFGTGGEVRMGFVDSPFTRMFHMQSVHNTLKGIEEGRYADESKISKQNINKALNDVDVMLQTDPLRFRQFLDTAQKSRNRNLVGFLLSSFRNAAGLPENYKNVLSGEGFTQEQISQAMNTPIRLEETPNRDEMASRIARKNLWTELRPGGSVDDAWMARLKENADLLALGSAKARTRFNYFRIMGLPYQWSQEHASPYQSSMVNMRARPSGLEIANFDPKHWSKYAFGTHDASVYGIGAAFSAVNYMLMRAMVRDRNNPDLLDEDALRDADSDMFSKNMRAVVTQRNTALTSGNKYERQAIRDFIESEKHDPNVMHMPMGGFGFYANSTEAGVDIAGSPDLFTTTRDPATGKLSVVIRDFKATRLSSAISHGSWTIPGRDYTDEDREITGAELRNVIPSDEFGTYSIQTEAYRYLAVAQTMEERKNLGLQINAKRRREHDAAEDAAEEAAKAAGTPYTRKAFVETPITEKDFDLRGEHVDSEYAKMIDQWAGTIAAGRTGVRIPINDVLRKKWEDSGDHKKWLAEKERIYGHVQEMFEAISEGRVSLGGVIIPNEIPGGKHVVEDPVESFGREESRRLHDLEQDAKEAEAAAKGETYERKPWQESGFSVTPILGGKHAVVSVRQMERTGENSFQALLNKYPTAVRNTMLKVGKQHLSMIGASLDQALKNRNVFMGRDRQTGEINSSDIEGVDISPLFADQIKSIRRGMKSTIPISDVSGLSRFKDIDGLEETAGVLGVLQQITGFSAQDLSKMEHALRGYERERLSPTEVRYTRVGNGVVGFERSGPAILSEDRQGTLTDADIREMVIAMTTQRAGGSGRTRTVTQPIEVTPREYLDKSVEWHDAKGVRRSPLEVVASSVREMLSPSGDNEFEQLRMQQSALDVLKANNVFQASSFDTDEWRDAYAEPDPQKRVKRIAEQAGRLMAQEYEGEFANINPPWANVDTNNREAFATNASGGVYYKTGKNATLFAVNPQIAGLKGGLDAAWMVTMRMSHAITQANVALANSPRLKPDEKLSFPWPDVTIKDFELQDTAYGAALMPSTFADKREIEKVMAERAAQREALLKDKQSFADRQAQMHEENQALFEQDEKPISEKMEDRIRKYLTSEKVSEMYEGVKAFQASPDHRSWFWDRHLRLMAATSEFIMNNIEDGDRNFRGIGRMDLDVAVAMMFGHDLMKAQTTAKDLRTKNKKKKKGENWDPEDDKTPAMELARQMGLSDEQASKVGKYLTMMDQVKKKEWKGKPEDMPWEVRFISTLDALTHYSDGKQGFANIFSTVTWPFKNRGRNFSMFEVADSNAAKMEKDARKILMNVFAPITRKRGLFGTGPETTQIEMVEGKDVIKNTQLAYDPGTKETHVFGMGPSITRAALEDLKAKRDAHLDEQERLRKLAEENKEEFEFQPWEMEDMYSGKWLDEMLEQLPERKNLLEFDAKAKQMKMFKSKGKGRGGKMDKDEIEVVGEFGQEIVSADKEGQLHVVPNSAIRREDSETLKSYRRVRDNEGFARARGGIIGAAGAVVGEVGAELKLVAADLGLGPRRKLGMGKGVHGTSTPFVPFGERVREAWKTGWDGDGKAAAATPADAKTAAVTPVTPTSSPTILDRFRKWRSDRKAASAGRTSASGKEKEEEVPTKPVTADDLAGKKKTGSGGSSTPPLSAAELHDKIKAGIAPTTGGLVFAGQDSTGAGVPLADASASIATAVTLGLREAGMLGGEGGGGIVGGSGVSRSKAGKWIYSPFAMKELFTAETVDKSTGAGTGTLVAKPGMVSDSGELNLGWSNERITHLLALHEIGTSEASGIAALQAVQMRGNRATLEDMNRGVKFLEEWIGASKGATDPEVKAMTSVLNRVKDMRSNKLASMGHLGAGFSMPYKDIEEAAIKYNEAFAKGSKPADVKGAMQSFTEQLTKSSQHLQSLNDNLEGMVKSTKSAESVYRDLARNSADLGKWLERAKAHGLGETPEGQQLMKAAEFELNVQKGQLQRGSDLYKEVEARFGTAFADKMVKKYGNGEKDNSGGVLTTHALHEINRSAKEVVQGSLQAVGHYAGQVRAERGILAPINQNLAQSEEQALKFEAARDNWNRNIGANVASMAQGLYNMDPKVNSVLRAANQVAGPAMGAMNFMANLSNMPGMEGRISTGNVLSAGLLMAAGTTLLDSFLVSKDKREMASTEWIRAQKEGSLLGRDFMSMTGRGMRDVLNLFGGQTTLDTLGSMYDEVQRIKEDLKQYDSVREYEPSEAANRLLKTFQKNALINEAIQDPEIVKAYINGARADKASGPSELWNTTFDEAKQAKVRMGLGALENLERAGYDIKRMPSPEEKEKIDKKKNLQTQLTARESELSNLTSDYFSNKNWEEAIYSMSADQVNKMAPYKNTDDINKLMKGANRKISPIALSLWRDTFVSRPGQEEYNEYRQYGLSMGLSDSGINMAAQQAQLYAGAPGTPIYTAAYKAFAERASAGEDIMANNPSTVTLARELGAATGDMSFNASPAALFGRNYTGTLLTQEQLYNSVANAKQMNVAPIVAMSAVRSGVPFSQIRSGVERMYTMDAMTPDVAQYQSNMMALEASKSEYAEFNRRFGTNVEAPNFGALSYRNVTMDPGTSMESSDVTYANTLFQIRDERPGMLPLADRIASNRSVGSNYRPVSGDPERDNFIESIRRTPGKVSSYKGDVKLPSITSVSPEAHRASQAWAELSQALPFGTPQATRFLNSLGVTNAMIEDAAANNPLAYEGYAKIAMGDQEYISGLNWNSAPDSLKRAMMAGSITPTIDSTTGQPIGQASMNGLRYPGAPGQLPIAIQAPTWKPGMTMGQWKNQLQSMGTVAGIQNYFNAQAGLAAKNGMPSLWGGLSGADKGFYSRLLAGDVLTTYVGGQETPLAGAQAAEVYAGIMGAQSQMASAGASLKNLKLQHQFELDWSRPMEKYQREQKKAAMFGGTVKSPFGSGTLDYGKGRFYYQAQEMDIQKRDMEANYGQNMARLGWQTEDLTRERGRQLVRADWQREDFGFQRRGMFLNREQQEYGFAFQKREMDISKQSYREDFAYNKRMRQMQFGWQMEDADINIRRATGFERKQLIKQKERETVAFNAEAEQNEKVNKRQEDAFKRQEEKFAKELEHYKKSKKLEDEQYSAQLKRFEQQQKWEEQDFNIKMSRSEQEKGWLSDSFARQMERFNLEKEQFDLEVKNQAVLAEDEKKYQEAAWKLSDDIYKNNLAAAGAAAAAAKASAVAAEAMRQAAGDTQKGVEIMTRFFQDTRWSEVEKAMDKIIEMWTKINGGAPPSPPGGTSNTGNSGSTSTPPIPPPPPPSPRPSHAEGGYIDTSKSVLVGEHGPEIITVDKRGNPFVIPNSAIPRGRASSGSNEVIHIHVMMDSNEIATYTAGKANSLAARNRRRAFNG